MNEKICSKCRLIKPIDLFYRQKDKKSGRFSRCKKCVKEYYDIPKNRIKKLEYQKSPRQKENHRIYYNKQRIQKPWMQMYYKSKQRAKREKWEFNLTPDYIESIFNNTCPVFGYKYCFSNKCIQYNSPSLDRIDNSKGYVIGNVQVISMKANTMKNKASPDELLIFAKWVLKNFGGLNEK
jgi:hypothetical protein